MKTNKTTKWIKTGLIAGFMITASVFTGCKDDDETSPLKTIAQTVIDDPNFSFLEAAVVKADLGAALSETGPFTVFAPTNQAFINAGFANEAAVSAAPADVLANILTYHVLQGNTTSAALPTAANTSVVTLNTANAFITKNSSGVTINGARVVQADVAASNGTIHVIDAVLTPPAGNIVATASANANLSYLVAAVVRASEGSTNVAQILSSAGPYTVFAPTNQAFINAGFATIASIQAADPNVLAGILTYHVINARILSTDLTEGATPTTAASGTVRITLTGGAKVTGNGNGGNASNITAVNIITTNGVVHVIDRVLLP